MNEVQSIRQADLGNGAATVFASQRSIEGACLRREAATHPYAVLSFFTDGDARIEQRGHWTMVTGDVFLTPPGEPHRLMEGRASRAWGLGFAASCFASDDARALLEPFDRVRNGAAAVIRVPRERHAFLESLFAELTAATALRPERDAVAVQRSLLTLIVSEVNRAASWKEEGPSGGLVPDALRFIERNCLKKLGLAEVARAVGKSPAYVTSSLTRVTGRSAVAWIIAGRMAEARRLLLHSDERIDIVSERVGYADPTHFIRIFRREHGQTPAAWRITAKSRSVPARR